MVGDGVEVLAGGIGVAAGEAAAISAGVVVEAGTTAGGAPSDGTPVDAGWGVAVTNTGTGFCWSRQAVRTAVRTQAISRLPQRRFFFMLT